MKKRLIDMSPREMQNLTKEDLFQGIKASEGRTLFTFVSPAAPNLIEHVSNIEACASFGADCINFQGFNPRKLIAPGLPSKTDDTDAEYAHLQFRIGEGYTVKELKRICGRPIGATLQVPDVWGGKVEGLNAFAAYNKEYVQFLKEEGYDFIVLAGLTQETVLRAVNETRESLGDDIMIEAGTPHGPGDPGVITTPFNLREISTPEYVTALAEAGADLIDIPAVGVTPGFHRSYVEKLIDAIHEKGKLAAVCCAHSIEGTSPTAIEKIVIENKIAGADVFNLAAAGLYESMALPETIMAASTALKGKRYTYRRMCQSVNR